MTTILRRLRLLDYIFFAFIICIALWIGFFLYAEKKPAQRLIIESPQGKWIYPLSGVQTIHIPGALGNTVIQIKNASVFIIDSPCPNKTCINTPVLQKAGDWNACLPNKVFLHIDGQQEDDIVVPKK